MQARCHKELAQQAQEQKSLAQQEESLQGDVSSNKDRLEQFQKVMDWNEEELQRWAAAAVEKEEDRLALAQYQRQDESKVKDLNTKLERHGKANLACSSFLLCMHLLNMALGADFLEAAHSDQLCRMSRIQLLHVLPSLGTGEGFEHRSFCHMSCC